MKDKNKSLNDDALELNIISRSFSDKDSSFDSDSDDKYKSQIARIEENIVAPIVNENDIDLLVEEPITTYILKELLEWLFIFVLAFVIALLINRYVIETTEVIGESMLSTLHPEEKLFINKFLYVISDPKRGDIIVFSSDKEDKNYVKRIIALPGETIDLRNGNVYINGIELEEEYLDDGVKTYNLSNGKDFPYTLGSEEYFAMGDNRTNSYDCRSAELGAVIKGRMRGKVICRVYPFNNLAWFKKPTYPGGIIKDDGTN